MTTHGAVRGIHAVDLCQTVFDVAPLLDGRVMARLSAVATHAGEVFGIPATGRRITMHELYLMRFRDGKLVELFTGGLNPLEFEMVFAPAISAIVLRSPS